MSTSPVPEIPGLEGAPRVRPTRRRHALGLPAGSIRALLTAIVFGLLAALLVSGEQGRVPLLYNYLWYLLLLIVAHFFAAHGNSIRAQPEERSPLGLPRGFFRFIFVAGFAGLIAWLYYQHQGFEPPPVGSTADPLIVLAGFFVGVCIARIVGWTSGAQVLPFWFQDLQAWVALIAVFALAIQVIVLVFINPYVSEGRQLFTEGHWEKWFAAIVGFYFGARS
jgi:hypothetical protein